MDTVRAHRGIEIDLDRIPLDDAATFELLASGETTGIFQLESAGMRRYVRELRPTSVFDLAAMVALYRPGPMDNIPAYIRRKHGQEPVTYLHPLLEPFLERTYGIFVYQEDIMAAAIALGGFTGPEADTLGYAIRKKKSSVLRAQKERFVSQAAERGVPPQTIDAVFKAFEPFERYGFNKAHATCYGLIAYQTAYLKANYTVEYMTSVLSAFRSSEEKVAAAVAECRRLGIEVRPPDIHESQLEFTVEGDAIRFGLLAVKNVGQGAIESIIAARAAEGAFRSLTDFCTRIDLRLDQPEGPRIAGEGRRAERLRAPGAGDHGPRRRGRLRPGHAARSDHRAGLALRHGCGRRGVLERPLPSMPEAPVRERLRWEKELLGLYLSEHPMGEVADRIGDFVTAYSADLRDESLDGQRLVLCGIVVGSRMVVTRARATMAVVTIEDLQGSIEVVVFPKLYEQTAPTWVEGSILLVAGRVDHRGEDVSLLADLVVPWDDAIARGAEAFARDVAAGDRGGSRRRVPGTAGEASGNGNGSGYRNGSGSGNGNGHRNGIGSAYPPAPARPEAGRGRPGRAARTFPTSRRSVPMPPGTRALPSIAPAEPVALYPVSSMATRPRARAG